MALEQEHQQQQQQQQQQQGWNNEMSQAGKEQAASLGVYTPDSSTNSVHSLHGYPESHENMAEQASYTPVPDTNTEPVHNTSVMESPSSIASVEMSGQYGEVHPRPVHTVNSSPGISNSPSHPPTSNQSPSAGIHNMTSHSPHPIQSPPPPMQPSPHQSPHPPYTNLPHQSPTGSGYATPAPPPGRQPSSSSKSPGRGSRSGLSSSQQTQQQLVRQQLTQQYQYDQYAQALAAQGLLGKQHRGHEAAAAYSMFPPTTMASFMSPYYSSQPGHGHSSQSTSHLSRLHQLTQTLDIQGQPVPQAHVPHPSPPPQKPSKSSKSRGSVAASSHLGLPPGYPHYGGQHVGQQVGQVGRVAATTSGPNQARPPNQA